MHEQKAENFQIYCRIISPGKAILCGQHAVVYGQDAIAFGISLYCQGIIKRQKRRQNKSTLRIRTSLQDFIIQISQQIISQLQMSHIAEQNYSFEQYQTLKRSQFNQKNHELSLYYKLSVYFNITKKKWKTWIQECQYDYMIDITSDIPIGKCLGSSAAFNTVLAASFAIIFDQNYTKVSIQTIPDQIKDHINSISVLFEKVEHGTPSGIDNYVSVHGGVILYNKNANPKYKKLDNLATRIKNQLFLYVADSGIQKNTKVAVTRVRQSYESDEKYRLMIAQIGQITKSIIRLLDVKQQDLSQLIKLVTRNHEILRDLGVSHPEIERIVSKWQKLGWGAKITGSGMGGCVLLLSLDANGIQNSIIPVLLDQRGLTIDFYKQSI